MTTVTFLAGSGDTDITSYVQKATYDDDVNAIDKLDLLITRDIRAPTITTGLAVKMQVDGTTHFNGYIDKYDYEVNYDVKCVSNAAKLAREQANDLYDSTLISTIATNLISTYTNFGTSNIQTTTRTLSQFKADNTVYDAMEKLAKVMDWQWYVTPDDEFYFEPKGNTSSGQTLTVGTNCYKVGKWNYDSARMVNYWIVKGGRREVQKLQTFNGDASTVTFTLTYKPVGGTRVIVDNAEQKLGIAGASTSYDYTVDEENKTITFEAASTPGTGTDNIEVYYHYTVPTTVKGGKQSSIDTYGTYAGRHIDRNLQSRDDVKDALQKLLDQYGEPFTRGTLKTSLVDTSLRAGRTVVVTDSVAGITSETFTIKEVKIKYGKNRALITELVVGTGELKMYDYEKDLDRRIKELERLVAPDEDFITKLVQTVDDLNTDDDTATSSLVVKIRSIGDTAILDHTGDNGSLDDTGCLMDWQGSSYSIHDQTP